MTRLVLFNYKAHSSHTYSVQVQAVSFIKFVLVHTHSTNTFAYIHMYKHTHTHTHRHVTIKVSHAALLHIAFYTYCIHTQPDNGMHLLDREAPKIM